MASRRRARRLVVIRGPPIHLGPALRRRPPAARPGCKQRFPNRQPRHNGIWP
jgi:hypothetical protein